MFNTDAAQKVFNTLHPLFLAQVTSLKQQGFNDSDILEIVTGVLTHIQVSNISVLAETVPQGVALTRELWQEALFNVEQNDTKNKGLN